jgi:hypothetical protein
VDIQAVVLVEGDFVGPEDVDPAADGAEGTGENVALGVALVEGG